MGIVTTFVSCCLPTADPLGFEDSKGTSARKVAKGIDLILGVALTAIALYGLLSGSIPQGISQVMLGVGATYLGLVLFKILKDVKKACVRASNPF